MIPVITLNNQGMIGSIKRQIKNKNIMTKRKPCLSILSLIHKNLVGNRLKNTLDPSRGVTGIILNTAKTILIMTIIVSRETEALDRLITEDDASLIKNEAIPAISIFDTGPARATRVSPHFPHFRL